MLQLRGLEAGYGKKQVLFGVDLGVSRGEIVALIGPNGSGKSTLLKSVVGLLRPWGGRVSFDGAELDGSGPAENVRRGLLFSPQGNRVFNGLTVRENLELGGFHLPKGEREERIAAVVSEFPILEKRLEVPAGKLSGGERQQLALARVLVPKPKLLLLDEPSLGLSPKLVGQLFEKIAEINADGVTILMVEQRVNWVLKLCQRVYSLKLGHVAYVGYPDELRGNQSLLRELFL